MAVTLEKPAVVPAPSGRTITWGQRTIPVMGPSVRDPRIHLTAVIVSIITIGTAFLDWRLTIPQIVIPVLINGLIEAAYRLRTTGALMWPASGMQTATSTVVLLRVTSTEHGDWWSFAGVQWFVGVSVAGLITKYVIRTRRGHVFNPSNVALVVAFLLAGATRIEPLDFWWGELDWALTLAWLVILVGGLTLCGRVGMLGMAGAFWITFAAGIGLLAVTGQSITARWSFAPVEGWHFWRSIALSPETFVFMFFMISDPKTTPLGRVPRAAFGFGVGVLSTLLLAPWPTEFGAKVGFLAGLTVMTIVRPLLERRLAGAGSDADQWSAVVAAARRPRVVAAATGTVAVVAAGVVLGGLVNHRQASTIEVDADAAAQAELAVSDEDWPIPTITWEDRIAGISQDLATPEGAQRLVEALYFDLAVEAEAIAAGNPDLLVAVNHGQRLIDLTAIAEQSEPRRVPTYAFDTAHLALSFPGGFQSGPNAAVSVIGTVTYDGVGTEPIDTTFTLRQTPDGQWLITGTLPA